MKIIGCGGRDYTLQGAPLRWITEALRLLEVTEIIDGGAPGADSEFHRLALQAGIDNVRFFANWVKFKNGAGPIRNMKQLRYLLRSASLFNESAAVIALPGGRGTQNMICQAVAAGVRVIAPTEEKLQGNIPISTQEIFDAHLR